MNTLELKNYYSSLLISQYLNFPNASGTISNLVSQAILPQTSVQTITFNVLVSSGTFLLSYNDENSAAINWNDDASTIQSKLQAITGLSSVTVTGSIASLLLTVTFTGVTPPALSLVVVSNSTGATITVTETDLTLPQAVLNAFNMTGPYTAIGAQLDVIGKYVGVSRTGYGLFTPTTIITLDDTDFLTLIKMAIIKNSSGSSLATIQAYIYEFFAGEMLVYDSTLMFMTFVISDLVGSEDLLQLFITEGLLPVPMAVGYNVIFGPSSEYFSFRTYELPQPNGFPFNNYDDPQVGPWLSYQNSVYPFV